jgi:hypothetical protein
MSSAAAARVFVLGAVLLVVLPSAASAQAELQISRLADERRNDDAPTHDGDER